MSRKQHATIGLALALVSASAPMSVALRAQTPAHRDSTLAAAPAYRYRVLGVFDDETGKPIDGVQVSDVLSGTSALTSRTGTVSLFFLPDGGSLVRLRKLGYAAQLFTVAISRADTTPLTVTMRRARVLDTVHVRDSAVRYLSPSLRGFQDRMRAGLGHYIDEAEMRKHENDTMGDLLVSHVPGLMTVPGPRGTLTIASSRTKCSGPTLRPCRIPDCYPAVFVDGVKANLGPSPSQPPDWSKISPMEYAAAEYYASPATTPVQFSGSECGVLLLWTRER